MVQGSQLLIHRGSSRGFVLFNALDARTLALFMGREILKQVIECSYKTDFWTNLGPLSESLGT